MKSAKYNFIAWFLFSLLDENKTRKQVNSGKRHLGNLLSHLIVCGKRKILWLAFTELYFIPLFTDWLMRCLFANAFFFGIIKKYEYDYANFVGYATNERHCSASKQSLLCNLYYECVNNKILKEICQKDF